MQKNFFTKRKIITFYSKMEKHKIFEKIKIFYETLTLNDLETVYMRLDVPHEWHISLDGDPTRMVFFAEYVEWYFVNSIMCISVIGVFISIGNLNKNKKITKQ